MYMFSILNLMKKDSLYNHGMCVPNMGHAMMVCITVFLLVLQE